MDSYDEASAPDLSTATAGAPDLPRDRDAAVAALFRVHHARLVVLARFLVGDTSTAEDLVQDAFVALYRRWPFMGSHDNCYPYLRTSVINGSRSQLRRLLVARSRPVDSPQAMPSAEADVVRRDEHARLLSHLETLPSRQRQVLVLRYYLDMSEAEIAHALGITRGSVKQHASRGMTALSSRLEEQR